MAFAQDQSALRKKNFNLDDDVAIDGYDPVAYFKINKAVKGKEDLAVNHQRHSRLRVHAHHPQRPQPCRLALRRHRNRGVRFI